MGEMIKIKATDGFELNGYLAQPEGKARGGVIVIQEVWGVNSWVRSVADRFARHGYLAVAPALFDRVSMGFVSDTYTGTSIRDVEPEKMQAYDFGKALMDVAGAVKVAGEGGKVGITGYCFGGQITWRAASSVPGLSAASGYYGGGVPNYIEMTPKVPTEMHFGETDKGIPLDQVEQLRARHPDAGIYIYPNAVHGFCNSDRPENFNEAACKKASARTLEFFGKHLSA